MKSNRRVPLLHRVKLAGRKVSPRHLARQLRTMQVMRKFADDLGLVYFGTASERQSDVRHIGGITTSNSHFDRHLVVGSYKGYSIAFAVRRDSIADERRAAIDYAWTILAIDLRRSPVVAPLQILNRAMNRLHGAKYSQLTSIPLDRSSAQSTDFLRNFSIYGQLANRHFINQLLSDELLYSLGSQTAGISIEITEEKLYIYLDKKYPRRDSLTRVLNLGIWLAQTLDA